MTTTLVRQPAAPAHAVPMRDRSPAVAAAAGAAMGAALTGAVYRALPDDAWITLGYARNLAHGHWTLVAGLPNTNTQTSPLNAWLLGALLFHVDRPVIAVAVVLVASLALTGWQLTALARRCGAPRAAGIAAVLALGCSPLLVSTVGLETYLGVAVLVSLARYAGERRTVAAGLLSGVAVLVRPDMAVPAAVLVAVLLAPRSWWRAAALAVLVAAPWHLFAWWRLGGLVPDTLWFKTLAGGMPNLLVAAVTTYGREYPVATALSALPVLAGTAAAIVAVWRRPAGWRLVVALASAGWAHAAALSIIGAFPQAWYYAPIIGCTTAAAVLGLPRPRILVAAAVVLAATCAVWAGPLPWVYAPMATNFASTAQYERIGADVGRLTAGAPVGGPGEIGVLAASSTVPVLDFFSDRALARPYLDLRAEQAGPVLRTLLAWNWAHRPNPPAPALRWQLAYASLPHVAGHVVASWPVSSPSKPHPDRMLLISTNG